MFDERLLDLDELVLAHEAVAVRFDFNFFGLVDSFGLIGGILGLLLLLTILGLCIGCGS